jgi:hypothetical protein
MPSRDKRAQKKATTLGHAFNLLAGFPDDFDPRGPAQPTKKQVPPLRRTIRKRIARLRSE